MDWRGWAPLSASPTLDEVASVYVAQPAALAWASSLLPVAWLAGPVFAAAVVLAVWRDGSAAARGWALIGFGGMLMQCAAFAGVEAARIAIAGAAASDGSVGGFWALHNSLFGFNQVFLCAAMLGLSLAMFLGRAAPRWVAYVGFVGAAALFVSSVASAFGLGGTNPLATVGLVAWLVWIAWIVSTSVVLLRGRRVAAA